MTTQLPQDPLNEMTGIIRHIGISALQSAELEQTFENLELLQAEIAEDMSNLKTVLTEFSQDDLKLFAALFQNQAVAGPGNSNTDQNILNSDLLQNGGTENFLNNLFRIDVTSQSGSLAALDLTSSIINILSSKNSEPGLLESLLNSLNDLSFNFQGIGSAEQNPDNGTTQQESGIADRLEQASLANPALSNLFPPTIISLAG
ncbi:MAG: hypothetical protein WC836_12815 [Desulfobacula sp.]|jgi:hypothetical protein